MDPKHVDIDTVVRYVVLDLIWKMMCWAKRDTCFPPCSFVSISPKGASDHGS